MASLVEQLEEQLVGLVATGFGGRLLDRGLARGLIWQDGVLPPESPTFTASLTNDLLDYAHTVLSLAVQLRRLKRDAGVLPRAFLVAGEGIEAAVHRGAQGPDIGLHRVSAAAAFHLGRYSARAFSILPSSADDANLSPAENALARLLVRDLDSCFSTATRWLLREENSDVAVATRLRQDDAFEDLDAVHLVLTGGFMRGLALYDHALAVGSGNSAAGAVAQLDATAEAAADLGAVSHWWTARLAAAVIDDLWDLSFHTRLPLLEGSADGERWAGLRLSYIQRLRLKARAAVEIWPSQLDAVRRCTDIADDLVVALPTSAGKTRVAELSILRTIASGKRAIYVTPLRALSAQIERDLSDAFAPLGIGVSSLYGSAGIEAGDADTLRTGQVVVATPEKLDFAMRNSPNIIDDVGVIVLDEGHMLGVGEREVRYEALVQRLLRRSDSNSRRLVCLSALFPTPEEMRDLTAWIRSDAAGEPVFSAWRPTRQRYGTVRWMASAGRLDVKIEDEESYIHRFIEPVDPPVGSKRKTPFPNPRSQKRKFELTLAVARKFVDQGKRVLVYCPLRKSVETIGDLALKSIEHGVLEFKARDSICVRNAIAAGTEWLGEDHVAVKCLHWGIALHHGGLPRSFLNEIEAVLQAGDCDVIVASPTLAQGLNLSASVLLVPSIWRNEKVIPASEFANVAGRAGRAFVDLEGLIIHTIWEDVGWKKVKTLKDWNALVTAAKAPLVTSGILHLIIWFYQRLAAATNTELDSVVEYIVGNDVGWDMSAQVAASLQLDEREWSRNLASLDSAILALLDAETPDDQVPDSLTAVLKGSLCARQLEHYTVESQKVIKALLDARARRIWRATTPARRRGYHFSGVGLVAGEYIDANLDVLVQLMGLLESGAKEADVETAAAAAATFAGMILQVDPFRPLKALPSSWESALSAWMGGKPSAEVLALGGEEGGDLLQDFLSYRLPWALEAVRVHALAVGASDAKDLSGIGALSVESGTINESAITLLRNGLSSREAAFAAVSSTEATFSSTAEMLRWLNSQRVRALGADPQWPTAASRYSWLRFAERQLDRNASRWDRVTDTLDVTWTAEPPPGSDVVFIPHDGRILVTSPDCSVLGSLAAALGTSRMNIVSARVADNAKVVVERFGPVRA